MIYYFRFEVIFFPFTYMHYLLLVYWITSIILSVSCAANCVFHLIVVSNLALICIQLLKNKFLICYIWYLWDILRFSDVFFCCIQESQTAQKPIINKRRRPTVVEKAWSHWCGYTVTGAKLVWIPWAGLLEAESAKQALWRIQETTWENICHDPSSSSNIMPPIEPVNTSVSRMTQAACFSGMFSADQICNKKFFVVFRIIKIVFPKP